jgi:hypothetical protein
MFTVVVDGLVTKVIGSNHYDHIIGTVTRRHLKLCLFLYQVYNMLGSLEIFLTVINTHIISPNEDETKLDSDLKSEC